MARYEKPPLAGDGGYLERSNRNRSGIGARREIQRSRWTAKGEKRASVGLDRLTTLWINTGTLCNITCRNCYIESIPSNDRLEYITAKEAAAFFDEAKALGTREIGFTGGEPFLNPDFLVDACRTP